MQGMPSGLFRLRYKIWLETTGKAFGEGPCSLLARVDSLGSLKRAAEDMNMSYSLAWNLIRQVEQKLGFSLLVFKVGGKGGGGAFLTPEARELLQRYQALMDEVRQALDPLFQKYFG